MMRSMKSMRRKKDLPIEGFMARWYNKNSRKHRLKEMREYAAMLAMELKTGGTVLEVAPGPGYLAIELAKLGPYRVVGLELSRTFVDIARANARAVGVEVDFRQGNVADIPFPADTYDAIVCTAAFKNFKDPVRALNEMYRVLKPGGLVLIVDMNRHATDGQIGSLTRKMGAKGFEALFLKLTFKYFLRRGAYTKEEFVGLSSDTGWAECFIEEEGIGFNIWLRK
jgi:ubiquinone/menaquinone biosynthesis C-methylase UbiE